MGIEDVTANFHFGLAESGRAQPNCRKRPPDLPDTRPGQTDNNKLHHGDRRHPRRI